jgi:hypothetical protein
MATLAQITANRANAQLSTGPRTEAGKAAVGQNRVTHGLSGAAFFLLPHEDEAEFQALVAAYTEEHQPQGTTASFLVQELAQAQWKVSRAALIEADIQAGVESSLARLFQPDSDAEKAFARLTRYQNGIRRDWYRALKELRAIAREQRQDQAAAIRREEREAAEQARCFIAELEAGPPLPPRPFPPPAGAKPPETAVSDNSKPISAPTASDESKPISSPPVSDNSKPISSMPKRLRKELARHRRRHPHFDPVKDAARMSPDLQLWFEKVEFQRQAHAEHVKLVPANREEPNKEGWASRADR